MGKKMRILAVDDDQSIVEILELALISMGHEEVLTASCAAEALDTIDISSETFDCILLDIQMPETDGVELCAMIRDIPGYRKTPIIMLTAMSDRKHIDRAFVAGATDYITKPFEAIELNARLSVAEKLNAEIRENSASNKKTSGNKLNDMADALVYQPAVNIEDSFDVDDVPGYMNFHAFQNYLHQLDHAKFLLGEILVLKIADISAIFERCGPKRYIEYVTDVAEAVSDNIYGADCVLSYAGYGYFVVTSSSAAGQCLSNELYSDVQQSVKSMGLLYPDREIIPTMIVQSSVKKPTVFGGLGNQRIIKLLIEETEQDLATRFSSEGSPFNLAYNKENFGLSG
ncbi:MAG: CheY-like chemotaxis protein [Paracoccaceae bacterium]|jgi:CheY-like chemotaxis protein